MGGEGGRGGNFCAVRLWRGGVGIGADVVGDEGDEVAGLGGGGEGGERGDEKGKLFKGGGEGGG